MRTHSRLHPSALGLLLVALAGCGGRYHRDATVTTPSFAGSYIGSGATTGFTPYNFSAATTAVQGTVSEGGDFTATLNDTATGSPFAGLTGTLTGHIDGSGTVTDGTIAFAGHNVITFSGSLPNSVPGHIFGTLNAVFTPVDPSQPTQNGTITLDLNTAQS